MQPPPDPGTTLGSSGFGAAPRPPGPANQPTLVPPTAGGPANLPPQLPPEVQAAWQDPRNHLDRYVIVPPALGTGGFGAVYRAWDGDLSQWVAVKVLFRNEPDAVARFQREVKTLYALRHPGIVGIRNHGRTHTGNPYLAMDLVPGRPLDEHVKGGLAPLDAAQLVAEVAEAVHHAHEQGVIHRDLKPVNVMVSDDLQRTWVLDFGLARSEDMQRLTQTGAAMGTVAYMSPEQADGHHEKVGPHSDVYGLGATLYYALTGKPPFERESTISTFNAILSEPPVPPTKLRPGIPPALEAACLACLAKEPGDRHASAQALADALREAAAPATEEPPPRVAGGSLWAGALTGLLIGGLALGVVWHLRGEAPPAQSTPTEAQPTPTEAPTETTEPPTGTTEPITRSGPDPVEPPPDSGSLWEELGKRLELASIDALVVAPNQKHAVYAGSKTGHVAFSLSGGVRWIAAAPLEGARIAVRSLAVDPIDPWTVYAACDPGGLHRSVDGGQSWRQVLARGATAVAIPLRNRQVVYLTTSLNGVWRSSDGGRSWVRRATGLEGDASCQAPLIDPGSTGHVWIGTKRFGLARTRDGGRGWQALPAPPASVSALARDPSEPNRIYLGAQPHEGKPGGLFRSEDDGRTWTSCLSGEHSVEQLQVGPRGEVRVLLEDGRVLGSPDGSAFHPLPGCPPQVSAIALDRDGNLYVGTRTGALHGLREDPPRATRATGQPPKLPPPRAPLRGLTSAAPFRGRLDVSVGKLPEGMYARGVTVLDLHNKGAVDLLVPCHDQKIPQGPVVGITLEGERIERWGLAPKPTGQPVATWAEDVDGDGRSDMAVLQAQPERGLWIHRQLRPGSWATQKLPGPSGGVGSDLELIRVGPTRTPVLVSCWRTSEVWLHPLKQDSFQSFRLPEWTKQGVLLVHLSVADWNDDGLDDLAAIGAAGQVFVWTQDGEGGLRPRCWGAARPSKASGRTLQGQDLIIAPNTRRVFFTLEYGPEGAFNLLQPPQQRDARQGEVAVTLLPWAQGGSGGLECLDIEGRGRTDVVWVRAKRGHPAGQPEKEGLLFIHPTTDFTRFQPNQIRQVHLGRRIERTATADVDGDGAPDLLLAGPDGVVTVLFTNPPRPADGDKHFLDRQLVQAMAGTPTEARIAFSRLIQAGADPRQPGLPRGGHRVLAQAAHHQHVDLVRRLLDVYGVEVNRRSGPQGETALISAAGRLKGSHNMVALLLDRGADPTMEALEAKRQVRYDALTQARAYKQPRSERMIEAVLARWREAQSRFKRADANRDERLDAEEWASGWQAPLTDVDLDGDGAVKWAELRVFRKGGSWPLAR